MSSINDKYDVSLETLILKYWKENEIMQKAIKKNSSGQFFNNMDGPPFVSSDNLHYGHILIGMVKSVVQNYQTML